MKRKDCDACRFGGSFPVFGKGFSRRRFFRMAGTTVVGSYFADVLNPPRVEAAVSPTLESSAKNCIFIFLSGAPSHTDMWDLKEGAWTPASFKPTSYGDIRFPQGLMPNTAAQIGNLAFVRSALSWAAVHSLAQSWAQESRNPAGVLGDVAPHIGAVVSLESQASRKQGDVLPGFIALNATPNVGAGYFPSRFAPFVVSNVNQNGIPSLQHPDGAARFADRYTLLGNLDLDRTPDAPLGKAAADMTDFYGQAKTLVDTPSINALFSYTTADYTRYGSSAFGASAIAAKQILGANKGARFVQITFGGWDNHSNIYAANGGINAQCARFDPAFGALLTDLAATPGAVAGKTLLDETLVVVLGEFGRTTGPLNTGAGRDHYQRMSVALAGGGIVGGRVIGATDALGRNAVDFGWSENRDIRIEDLTSTIYSALGIDYTTIRMDDPIGRGFEYVPHAKDGVYKPVTGLF